MGVDSPLNGGLWICYSSGVQVKITRSGSRRYLQVVQAYRDPSTGQPRQKHVATLGRLDTLGPHELDGLINGLLRAVGRQPLDAAPAAAVGLDSLVAQRPLQLGPVWAVLKVLEEVGVGPAVAEVGRGLGRMLVAHRALARGRELRFWLEETYNPDRGPAPASDEAIARALNSLGATASAAEQALSSGWDHGPAWVEQLAVRDERCPSNVAPQLLVMRSCDGVPIARQPLEPATSEVEGLAAALQHMLRRQPAGRAVLVLQSALAGLDHARALATLSTSTPPAVEFVAPLPLPACHGTVPHLSRRLSELAELGCGSPGPVIQELTSGGFRLLLVHSPALARTARRSRARTARHALRLAFTLSDRLDAQDREPARARPTLTDAEARNRFQAELARLGLDDLLRADLEDGEIFTWRWQLDPLLEALASDGAFALLSNARGLAASELAAAYLALPAHQSRYALARSDGGSGFELAPASLAELFFLADAVLSVMARNAKRAGDTRGLEDLIQPLYAIHLVTLELGQGTIRRGISMLSREARDALRSLDVPAPQIDELATL